MIILCTLIDYHQAEAINFLGEQGTEHVVLFID